jgi:hypothetical protein
MLSVGKDAPVTWKSGQEVESNQGRTVVYLTEEHRFGYLISLGAFFSRLEYEDDYGNTVDTFVENDEFIVWEEPFTYEQE